MTSEGMVYLIGAGPGDPGLMTLRGLECIAEADVIVYDGSVSTELLSHARKDARLVCTGSQDGKPTLSSEEINGLLVNEARGGAVVARLEAGDPFLFGRGAEEARLLVPKGVPFEIIPGINPAAAVPAYAGIPLPRSSGNGSVVFVKAPENPDESRGDLYWSSLAGMETLVFLTGLKNLPFITHNLMGAGRDARDPAVLICGGTTTRQRTLTGTLGDITEKAEENGFGPQSVFVVGDVAGLHETMNWFETRPLFGRGIVITRPEKQSGELATRLAARGARVINFPVIKIVPPEDWSVLDGAIGSLESYNWVIFTSANGVSFFFRRLNELGKDIRELKGVKIAAIGPATARAVEVLGIKVDLIPDEFIGEGVVRAFSKFDLHGSRILLARAGEARDVIPDGLSALGADVTVATAYRTICSDRDPSELMSFFEEGEVDVITFTSPSTVRNFIRIMGADFRLPPQVRVATIGPVTEAAAIKAGLAVHISLARYTIPELVNAISASFEV